VSSIVHLLFAAAAFQAFVWIAFVTALGRIAEALDRPLPGRADRHSHVVAVRRALARVAPLTVIAVAASAVLAHPALSAVMPSLTGNGVSVSDDVRGVFAAVWVAGLSQVAVVVLITRGLLVRLDQLRSAR